MRRVTLLLALSCGCSPDVTYDLDNPWADPTVYPDAAGGLILVTNSGDDTVSWLDLSTLEEVFREPVGRIAAEREGPHHAAAMPDGSAYFIGLSNFVPGSGSGPHGSHGTGSVPGYLLKYDTATHVLVGATLVDRSPGDVRITPDAHLVLQSHFDMRLITEVIAAGGTLEDMVAPTALIDPTAMTLHPDDGLVAMVPTCIAPHGIAPSADSQTAYVACWGSDELAVVGLTDPYPVQRFRVGEGEPNPSTPLYEPYAALVSPSDGKVWVSCLNTGDLRVFDPVAKTWAEGGPIAVGGAPFFGAFTADGSRLVMPVQGSNTLVFIDAATEEVTQTLELPTEACQAPHAVYLPPDGTHAVVVCEGDHVHPGTVAIVRLDLATPAVERYLTVGVFPDDAILVRTQP